VKIRELITVFGFQTQVAVLDGINQRVENLKATLDAVAQAASVAVRGLFGIAAEAAGLADSIGEQAQKLGLDVEAYQELAHAASLSGASMEQLGIALSKVGMLVEDAKSGGKAGADLLRRLGISADQVGTADQTLELLADRIAAMPDGIKKAALAQQALGRGGRALIPLLNEGGAGLRRMREQAQRLGIVLDRKTVKAGGELQDRLDSIRGAAKGVRYAIAAGLIPTLNDLSGELLTWWELNGLVLRQRLTAWAQELAAKVRQLGDWLKRQEPAIRSWIDALGGLDGILRKVTTTMLLFTAARVISGLGAISFNVFALVQNVRALNAAAKGAGIVGLTKLGAIGLFLAAAVATIALSYNELSGYLEGKSSVLELVFGKYREGEGLIGSAINLLEAVGDAFVAIKDAAVQVGGAIWSVIGPAVLQVWGVVKEAGAWILNKDVAILSYFFNFIAWWFNWLAAGIREFPSIVKAVIDEVIATLGRFFTWAGKKLEEYPGLVKAVVGAAGGFLDRTAQAQAAYAQQPAYPSVSGWLRGAAPNSQAINMTAPITINATTAAGVTATDIGREVRLAVQQASSDAYRGELRNFSAREE